MDKKENYYRYEDSLLDVFEQKRTSEGFSHYHIFSLPSTEGDVAFYAIDLEGPYEEELRDAIKDSLELYEQISEPLDYVSEAKYEIEHIFKLITEDEDTMDIIWDAMEALVVGEPVVYLGYAALN